MDMLIKSFLAGIPVNYQKEPLKSVFHYEPFCGSKPSALRSGQKS